MGEFVQFMPESDKKWRWIRTTASPVILPRGDEELLGGAIILIDGDHAGLEDGQGGDVGREDTEGARE